MADYGLQLYNSNGVGFLQQISPFNPIYRIRIEDLAIVTDYEIPIPNVETGSELYLSYGLFGASQPDKVVSLGNSYGLLIKNAYFEGNSLFISTSDSYAVDPTSYEYTIFCRRL